MREKKNNYYIYSYWRLDINEPFYIGKGKGRRWRDLYREYNYHFVNIINKCLIAVVIERENLSEEEAFYWEEKMIEELVFEYGFSIDIKECNSNDHYCHLVNMTWGGEGRSGANHKGENNPMFGKNPYEGKTEEEVGEIIRKRKETIKSKNIEELNEWYEKISKANKKEGNPMFGKHHTEETKRKLSEINKGKKISDATKRKIIKAKEKNGTLGWKMVICVTTLEFFQSIKDASFRYKVSDGDITCCCKGYRMKKGKRIKVKSAGKLPDGTKLKWMYLEDFLEKCEYTLL